VEIQFDHGPDDSAVWFRGASDVIQAFTPAEVAGAFERIEAARSAGKWLAGYATYEFGYVFEDVLAPLMHEDRRLPLMSFGVYDGPTSDGLKRGPAGIGPVRPAWDAARYEAAFVQVREWIGAGDIYQANLTFGLEADVSGTSEALYAALAERQPVGHGALVLQSDLPDLLSRSPELFFATSKDGSIETRPMKGTMPRGATPQEDDANYAFLKHDVKNRAENLMIVDLLRNDLSRISEVGSVKVPTLFEVETYATVHQMVSHVVGQMSPGIGLSELFAALFPCGSITGAPKVRSMEVIRSLELEAREAYCGTIGWAAPDGSSSFNVAIRTLMVEDGLAKLTVGGGVVWDSTSASEYEEALWKSRYAAAFQTA
jgi:para-aminobenzoate synthetase component 1